jgi:hypothetical protein
VLLETCQNNEASSKDFACSSSTEMGADMLFNFTTELPLFNDQDILSPTLVHTPIAHECSPESNSDQEPKMAIEEDKDVDAFTMSNLGSIPMKMGWETNEWTEFQDLVMQNQLTFDSPVCYATLESGLIYEDSAYTRRNSEISLSSVVTYGTNSIGLSNQHEAMGDLLNRFSISSAALGVGKSVIAGMDPSWANNMEIPFHELGSIMYFRLTRQYIENCVLFRHHELHFEMLYPKVAQKSYGNEKRYCIVN